MISDLIVNIAVLTSFTFFWHQALKNNRLTLNSRTKIKILDGIIGGVLGIILMHYSIQVNEITILDLRHIPVILVAYFGGFLPAIVSAAIISIGRFFIDVNFSSVVSLFMMFTMAIGAGIIVRYVKVKGIKKWTLLLLYSQFVFTLALYIVVDAFSQVLNIAFFHIVSSLIGGFLTLYFVNYIRRYTELYNQYKDRSQRDPLTGLFNVRSFDYYYNLMLEKAQSAKEDCAVCIIDIDYFKKVNDKYGHPAGDEVLKQLALLLKKLMRDGDIVARNGGEEFSVLLDRCNLQQAEEVACRIRIAVERHSFILPSKEKINITVSIGVASYNGGEVDPVRLYQDADDALYKAKHEGRNNVCVKGDS
ncbi:hypothetical protein BKP35_12075 [Anaerobacillus arseniciselenatis]|uniref:GGDEF domain-containing protein n=1 Tax=Anaerobacillus arseniciselenatis TaxID=85682 RepID=A0A1S2LH12_9BACI|nr:diguanylate cyclase [Anaerobacillus arseniciselenatis]OIJ11666.1 hypothetical protein BKP35_12075 [Anaerobacillus arseniciselenatis]